MASTGRAGTTSEQGNFWLSSGRAGTTSEQGNFWLSPGRAGHAIVPERPSCSAARSTQWRCRATLAV